MNDILLRHYVPAWAPMGAFNPNLQRAICKRFVDPHTEHAAEPTCATCAALIAREATTERKDVA